MSVLEQWAEEDCAILFSDKVHMCKKDFHYDMLRYVFTETEEHCIVDLFRTWSKTLTAARVINAIPIEERKDIFVLSARPFAQKAVKEFAKQIGATAIEGDNH
ncbi:unnamed protein product, partial [Cuscuta campestris]